MNESEQSGTDLFARRLRTGACLPPAGVARRDYLSAIVIAALALLAALLAWRIVSHLRYPYSLDPGEGSVLTSSWLSSRGEPFYEEVSRPPYTITVYNPLYVYLSGLTMRALGARPLGPRLLSTVFYLGAAVFMYLFVRRETASRSAAAVAALFMLVERHFYSRAAYAVVDHSAIFFSLAGLYLWRGGGRGRYVAVVSFALAFFSKQNSLSAAAACFAALFLEGRRKRSLALFGIFLLVVGAGLAICRVAYGAAYFLSAYSYVATAPFSLNSSIRHVALALILYAIPFAGGLHTAFRAFRESRFVLVALYLLFGLALSFTSGKTGASRSYFFDFAAALSIVVGLMWAGVAARVLSGRLNLTVASLVTLALFCTGLGTLYRFSPRGDKTPIDRLHDAAVKEAFMECPGLILSREHGLDMGTPSRNVSSDIYQLNLMIRRGRFSKELYLEPVRQRLFSLVIVPDREPTWKAFDPELRAAIEEHYRPSRWAFGETFYVPREAGGS